MSSSVNGTQPPRRVPTAAFIVGFGALLICCIILTTGVFSYESGAEERAEQRSSSQAATATTTTTTNVPWTTVTGSDGQPTISRDPKPAPPDTDLSAVNASIRPNLIANASSTRTYTGVAVTGDLTAQAIAAPGETVGHLSRLLDQNCLDSVGLSTPDNQRVTFTGFCYTTLPPETIQRMLTFAVDNKADAIEFSNNASRGNTNFLTMTWFADSEQAAENIQKTWNPLRRPRAIESVTLTTYTPEKAHRVVKSRGKPDHWRVDPMVAGEYETQQGAQ